MKTLVARAALYIYIRSKNSRPINEDDRALEWANCNGENMNSFPRLLTIGPRWYHMRPRWISESDWRRSEKKTSRRHDGVGGAFASRQRGLNKGSLTESGDPRWGSSLHFSPPVIHSLPMWEICAVCLDQTLRQRHIQIKISSNSSFSVVFFCCCYFFFIFIFFIESVIVCVCVCALFLFLPVSHALGICDGCSTHVQHFPGAADSPWHRLFLSVTVAGRILATGKTLKIIIIIIMHVMLNSLMVLFPLQKWSKQPGCVCVCARAPGTATITQ